MMNLAKKEHGMFFSIDGLWCSFQVSFLLGSCVGVDTVLNFSLSCNFFFHRLVVLGAAMLVSTSMAAEVCRTSGVEGMICGVSEAACFSDFPEDVFGTSGRVDGVLDRAFLILFCIA